MRQVVLIVCLLCLSSVSAQTYRAGEDEGGDSSNQIAPGADVGALISNDRTDILYVDFEESGDDLLVRLGLATLPAGTSGYLYRVGFDIGGTSYYTCWSVQWTAGDASLTQENILGCSRFQTGTQVGPATTGDGIRTGDNAITWPVPRSAIGGAGLEDIETAFADSWFRGVSDCCVGSTTSSRYMWNQADRGPDEGVFDVLYAAVEEATGAVVNVTALTNSTSAPPGGQALFVLNLTSSAPANVTLAANTTWNVTGLEPWDGVGNATQRTVVVTVPAGTPNGTYPFDVQAWADGNATAVVELTVEVRADAVGHMPEVPPEGAGNETAEDLADDASKDTPMPLWTGAAALALLARRRSR